MAKIELQEPEFKKELTSDFNEAKYQIYRIHNLLTKCHNYSEKGNLRQYKWVLDRLWIELSADAKQEKEEEQDNPYFKEIKKLNNDIANVQNDRGKLYETLQQKEIFLRHYQNKVGKGSKKSSSDEEEFD